MITLWGEITRQREESAGCWRNWIFLISRFWRGWSMASITTRKYLAMNPNGTVPLLKDDANGWCCGESTPLFVILPRSTGKTVCGWSRLCSARRVKVDGLGQRYAVPAHRPVLMGWSGAAGPARSGGH